jgi:hypothetical protein
MQDNAATSTQDDEKQRTLEYTISCANKSVLELYQKTLEHHAGKARASTQSNAQALHELARRVSEARNERQSTFTIEIERGHFGQAFAGHSSVELVFYLAVRDKAYRAPIYLPPGAGYETTANETMRNLCRTALAFWAHFKEEESALFAEAARLGVPDTLTMDTMTGLYFDAAMPKRLQVDCHYMIDGEARRMIG